MPARRDERTPWGPDDWDAWALNPPDEDPPPPAEAGVVAELLAGLPGRKRMTVADLGCGRGDWLPFLTAHFGNVVAVDYAPGTLAVARRAHGGGRVIFRRRDLRDLKPFRGTLHVALLLDSLVGPRLTDVDRVLQQVHASLVEGGMLVASVAAAHARGRAVKFRLAPLDDHGPEPLVFTEVDLQYRLRRAGFQGVRLKRFGVDRPGPDRLLAVATRRANN